MRRLMGRAVLVVTCALVWGWCVALIVFFLVGIAQGQTRVDLYDTKSNRTGSATVDESRGRFDLYDTKSNRTGYGTIDPKTGRIDTFDRRSNRTGSGQISGGKGRR